MEVVLRVLLEGKPVAWFAPTYKLLKDAWTQIKQTLDPIITRSQEAERLEVIGGGVLECWSLDKPDAGRGRAYACVVIDEAAMVRNLEQAWERSVAPTLTDYRGEAWFLSTPMGIASYFYTLYQNGQDPLKTEWASWRMPTSTNPFMTSEEIESQRQNKTALAFAQEYLAQFVTWEGAVFRNIMGCVGEITKHPAAIIGVDWARTEDFTVFIAISQAGQVVDIDRFRGIDYPVQRNRLGQFWLRNGRPYIAAEANNIGTVLAGQLRGEGLPVVDFWTTGPSKAGIIEGLALAFERGAIRIPNDMTLIGELQAFAGHPTAGGAMKYSAPSGQHDDTVMALAIGYAALTEPKVERGYMDPSTGRVSSQPIPYQISPI